MTYANLERAKDISLSLFDAAQADYVETAEILAAGLTSADAEARGVADVRARDFLWKRLNEIREGVRAKRFEEKLETGYEELFSYYPSIRVNYRDALMNMRTAEDDAVMRLLSETELVVLGASERSDPSRTALLGNALREVSVIVKKDYTIVLEAALEMPLNFLTSLIEAEDDYLIKRRRPDHEGGTR